MPTKSGFKKYIIPFAFVQFLASCVATASFAATTTGSFSVNATVSKDCAISFDGGMSVSLGDPTGQNTLSVICTNLSAWSLQFVGLHDEADFYTHKMADSGGTHFIRYILTGAATGGATMLFGEAPQKLGGNPTYNVSGTGTGAAQTMTITATAAVTGANSFQYAPQTSYSDTVTVTITF